MCSDSLGLGPIVFNEKVSELGQQDALITGHPLLKLRGQLQHEQAKDKSLR